MDSQKRSIIKTLSFRIVATIVTISLVYLFTRKLVLALEVGILEIIVKTIFYYLHERIWNNIKWGKVIEKDPGDLSKVKEQLIRLGHID